MSRDRLPDVLLGGGLLLVGVMLAEVLAIAFSPVALEVVAVVNFAATVPFVLVLVFGGWWLRRNDLQRDRHSRIGKWVLVGFACSTSFFVVIALFTQEQTLARISIVRWGAAAGAGVGALIGIFEARAIERAIAAEQSQIRNEELRSQNERLEEFASILTHDIRNPLNVANGYLELLRAEHEDDRFERIAMAHDRMEEIIEETLVLAQSGQTLGETDAVAISDLATQCWQNVATDAGTLKIENAATIVADPGRLQHLFENLFRNAVEHGGGDVTVRVGTLPSGFYVEDDGPGIPEDEREAILESGFSTKGGGAGFGLAIVRQIVDAHGWEVSVTESSDGGARFEISGVDVEPTSASDFADTVRLFVD